MARKQHRVRKTLLIVGEGDSEDAFLRYATKAQTVKKTIRQLIDIDLTESQGYVKHFSKGVLEAARLKVVELEQLLKSSEGR